MRGPLEEAGFDLFAARVLMVKHTVAWVKAAAQELVPALKGSAEPVPPALRFNNEPEAQPGSVRLAANHEP